jgi:hypothetical protein
MIGRFYGTGDGPCAIPRNGKGASNLSLRAIEKLASHGAVPHVTST